MATQVSQLSKGRRVCPLTHSTHPSPGLAHYTLHVTDDGGESLPLRSKHIYDLDALDGLEIGEFVVKVLRDPTKNSSPKGIVDIIVDEYKGLKVSFCGRRHCHRCAFPSS